MFVSKHPWLIITNFGLGDLAKSRPEMKPQTGKRWTQQILNHQYQREYVPGLCMPSVLFWQQCLSQNMFVHETGIFWQAWDMTRQVYCTKGRHSGLDRIWDHSFSDLVLQDAYCQSIWNEGTAKPSWTLKVSISHLPHYSLEPYYSKKICIFSFQQSVLSQGWWHAARTQLNSWWPSTTCRHMLLLQFTVGRERSFSETPLRKW